ncbi:hypothetical protein PR003_g2908 [Phytophthora rubi]|uniref:Uncharacterized protein n=1 Tax=Phytophthora rubi TaxID=129364 RepID=A0A6A4G7X8_9STRA|nr:hypothetical protein PR002_g1396 [Phytophthora rubi]KAE9355295.1 hypothetical protein PR003_g2908 [Phytophthora rubi]
MGRAHLKKSYHGLMREALHKNAHPLGAANLSVAAGSSTALA